MRINGFVPDTSIFDNMNNDVTATADKTQSKTFFDTLKDKIDEVNEMQVNAENSTESLVKGEDVDVHQVMLTTEEAKMSLEMAIQVRNKIIDAYQELTKMQI